MIDTTLLAVVVGFVVLLFTILWTDRRHDRRADRQDERLNAIEIDVAVIKAELVRINERADTQDERMDEQDSRLDSQDSRFDRVDSRFDSQDSRFDEMQRGINVLGSKIDRAQGNLDVLVFGERGVPPPVQHERAEIESRSEEVVVDD